MDFESTTPSSNLGGSSPLLAQLVEQWTVVPFVTCSIQVERTSVPYIDSTIVIFSPIAQLVERATVNRKVIGSNPVGREFFTFTMCFPLCKNNHLVKKTKS